MRQIARKQYAFKVVFFSSECFLAPGIETIMATRHNEWELSEEEGFVESCLKAFLMG